MSVMVLGFHIYAIFIQNTDYFVRKAHLATNKVRAILNKLKLDSWETKITI